MATTSGRIRAISISQQKGTPKFNVPAADLQVDHGIVGDAHAGSGHRQVSLLAFDSIEMVRRQGVEIAPGDFAENLTVEGLDLSSIPVGSRLRVGDSVELEVTQRGKQCHGRCAIFERLGDCIMPHEGIFARVKHAGHIQVGDIVEVVDD
ncbi:MAG: MOSC domain-containing protein [Phycisphaerales bacterium]|nr:MAG: MOSC domain-containing protein [Phycisphaerales bacterium]